MKIRLEKAKGKWAEELPRVLWAHRTIRKEVTDETPFSLAFDAEVVVSVEMGMPSYWVDHSGKAKLVKA